MTSVQKTRAELVRTMRKSRDELDRNRHIMLALRRELEVKLRKISDQIARVHASKHRG